MAGAPTEDQAAIREAARAFLAAEAGPERLRAAIGGDAGIGLHLWRGFAGTLGFAGIGVAERFGGSGLGIAELALVAEELGRTLAPIPWFESAVLAAQVIDAVADDAGKQALLGAIARGDRIATLAMRDAAGGPLPGGIGPVLTRSGDGWRLGGAAHFVPFGASADLLIVAARCGARQGWEGIALVALDAATPGVDVRALVSLDLTRPLARIGFDDVAVEPLAIGAPALRRALAVAGIVLAAEQLGGMQRSLDETVDYALQRIQFGRRIGSFQAVKHALADMKLRLEAARSAVGWAIEAAGQGDPALFAAASGARAACSDAYLAIAGEAIQLHGGIGFTWEHHAHLFFKRARSSATLLDSPDHHRAELARLILDEAA